MSMLSATNLAKPATQLRLTLDVAGVETLAHLADTAAPIAVVAGVSRAYTPPLHCIRSNAIVNVARGYAAITSCRKE